MVALQPKFHWKQVINEFVDEAYLIKWQNRHYSAFQKYAETVQMISFVSQPNVWNYVTILKLQVQFQSMILSRIV